MEIIGVFFLLIEIIKGQQIHEIYPENFWSKRNLENQINEDKKYLQIKVFSKIKYHLDFFLLHFLYWFWFVIVFIHCLFRSYSFSFIDFSL